MRTPLAVLLALLPAAIVSAQDKPLLPDHAADKVLAAFKAGDQATVEKLASQRLSDPWLVADELSFRGEHEAAEAFAKAASGKDTEKLPAYVAARRGRLPNTAAREVLEKTAPTRPLAIAIAIAAATPKVAARTALTCSNSARRMGRICSSSRAARLNGRPSRSSASAAGAATRSVP